MRVFKPDIVKHGQNAIYALDFQPLQGSGVRRLATAGGDSSVKLWDVDALVGSPERAADALLATLDYHSNSVNVCRWSKNGAYLASGSDDACVIVYSYTPNAAATKVFGSTAATSKESWTRKWMLHGHRMDVLDLAWSVSGVMASASIDNRILIWDVPAATNEAAVAGPSGGTLAPMKVLDGHSSIVKGVSFDPVGRHLASCGADNRLLIWSTETWQVIHVVSEPLRDSVDMTLFRRVDWAPDGGSLCLTSAVKKSKPVGMVLSRSMWTSIADLVGHADPTTCCRFYGDVLEKKKGSSKPQPSCVVALGDQHGLLSVWSTDSRTPKVVAKDLFSDAIVDISWTSTPASISNSPDNSDVGSIVLGACSLDGTIALLLFDPLVESGLSDLVFGHPMDAAALDAHFRKMYSQTLSELISATRSGGANMPVSRPGVREAMHGSLPITAGVPLAVAAMQFAKTQTPAVPPLSVAYATAVPMPRPAFVIDSNAPPPRPVVTSRPKDGKKRIAPMSLGAVGSSAPVAAVPPPAGALPAVGGFVGQVSATGTPALSSDSGSGALGGGFGAEAEHNAAKRQRVDSTSTAPAVSSQSAVAAAVVSINANGSSSGFVASAMDNSTRSGAFNGSGAFNDPPSAAARAGMTVTTVPAKPGELDPVKGGVLQYTVSVNAIVSTHALRRLGSDAAAKFSVVVPNTDRGSTNPSRLHQPPADAKIFVHAVERPAEWTSAFGGSDSVINNGGLSAMSIVQLKRLDVRGCFSASSDWTAVIPGRVVVGSVLRLPQPSAPKSNPYRLSTFQDDSASGRFEGIALLGATDGTLHVISLSSGQRVYPALSLGAPVVTVSAFTMSAEDSSATDKPDSDLSPTNEYYCMALCADGEVIVWKVDTVVYKPSGDGKPSSGHRPNLLRTAFIAKRGLAFAGLSLVFKTHVRPVVQSIRFPPPMAESRVTIDSVFLTSASLLSVAVPGRVSASGMILVAVVHAAGAVGGPYQVFRYIPSSGCWSRVSDLRYILSSSSHPPALNSRASDTATATGPPLEQDDSCNDVESTNLDLERLPTARAVVGTADVARAAGLLHQEQLQRQLGRVTATGPALDRATPSAQSIAGLTTFDWGAMVSLCHAEEKLSAFFFEISVHDKAIRSSEAALSSHVNTLAAASVCEESEIIHWLRQWILLSCKIGAKDNIKWLAERLLAFVRQSGKVPRLSNVSPHGSVTANGVLTGSPTLDVSPLQSPETPENSSAVNVGVRKSRIAVLSDRSSILNLYSNTVLPAIGHAIGTGEPTLQLLLEQLADALHMTDSAGSVC